MSPDDVKQFLTWLAVEQKCSASAQNQAFNGLLFFSQHILGKEFGKIDGVVRAKRKPYIPVVLSRKEIDLVVEKLRYPYNLIEDGYDGVFMFDAMDRKAKHAAKEFNWQWLFPAKELTPVPDTGERRLYHLHDRHVQKAIKSAANRLQLTKRVTPHTFVHSFASHLPMSLT